MTNIPNFIPATPGDETVIDLSHTLTSGALKSISNSADFLSYKPKVLVLPRDYVCPDVHQLSLDVAQAWHTSAGRTLLTVVDLKGHKVRMIGSPDLNASGVTTDYLRDVVIAKNFVPYMKAGDLSSAVRVSLVEVNKQVAVHTNLPVLPPATVANSSQSRSPNITYQQDTPSPSTTEHQLSGINWGALFGICIGLGILVGVTWLFMQLRINRAAVDKLRGRINKLYEKADQLALASDYVDSHEHPKLVHSVSDFFAQLQTLEKAYEQTKQLVSAKHRILDTKHAVAECSKYIDILSKNAATLLIDTNKLTGVVSTYEASSTIESNSEPISESESNSSATNSKSSSESLRQSASPKLSRAGNTIKLASGRSFQTPSWVVPSNYDSTNDDALALMSIYLDKQRRREELSAITATDYRINDYPSNNASSSSGYSGYSSNSSKSSSSSTNSDAGGSWNNHDSSSSSFSDSGGSWDSGSSSDSSSSSDAGGSW